jgi:hypothetical protein
MRIAEEHHGQQARIISEPEAAGVARSTWHEAMSKLPPQADAMALNHPKRNPEPKIIAMCLFGEGVIVAREDGLFVMTYDEKSGTWPTQRIKFEFTTP